MTTLRPFTYCSFCGARFPEGLGWPRVCPTCGSTSYRNPLPVAVVLQPVGAGLLVVRRAIPPKIGELALPGGFINYGESWQQAGARELSEETGLNINPASLSEFMVRSAPDSTLLIFALAPALPTERMPTLQPNAEVSELLVIGGLTELAFPLHTEAAASFFQI